jgi:hypothetical protein
VDDHMCFGWACCRHDITIDLIKYRWLGFHLMTGKLDWLLTRKCKVRQYLHTAGLTWHG